MTGAMRLCALAAISLALCEATVLRAGRHAHPLAPSDSLAARPRHARRTRPAARSRGARRTVVGTHGKASPFANFIGVRPFGNGRGGEQKYKFYAPAVKELTLEEANLTCSDLSVYGAYVPKVPQAWVKKIDAVRRGSAKTARYMFQGDVQTWYPRVNPRRHWIHSFAQEHFSDSDIFIATVKDNKSYAPLGTYDRTLEYSGSYVPFGFTPPAVFDATYFRNMARSTFTLCPGGDNAWSMRFYEAILAGSIPIINSVKEDYSHNAYWFNQLGYTFFTTKQVARGALPDEAALKAIAGKNRELALRYQTWASGDQVPPAYQSFGSAPCLSDPTCAEDCRWEPGRK